MLCECYVNVMWSQNHKPKRLDEIIGNQKLIHDLRRYHWKKPLIIYGSTGVGKSMLVDALVDDLNFKLVEVTNENIATAKATSQTASLFGGRKLLLIDNVDRIRNIKEVAGILKETKNPVILVTSDFSSKRLATIKRMCEKVQIRKPTSKTIQKILKQVCCKEGVTYDPETLEKIAENASGDVRSAINDLETLAKGKKNISLDDLEVLVKRDKTSDIYKALNLILAKNDFNEAIQSLYHLSEQPKDMLLWIDENMPYIYKDPGDILRAYEHIAKADIFIGRITNRQYWGFLRYASKLMSGGVNVSKKNGIRFTMYRFPSYFIKMSQTKKERKIKNSIGTKLSLSLHSSRRIIAKEYIPLFKTLLKNGKTSKEELIEKYSLCDEEIEYLSS